MGSTGSSAWLVWVVVSSRTCAVATLLCRPRSLASAPLPKHPTITMQRLNWTMTCDRPLQLGCNATQQSQGTTSGGQVLDPINITQGQLQSARCNLSPLRLCHRLCTCASI